MKNLRKFPKNIKYKQSKKLTNQIDEYSKILSNESVLFEFKNSSFFYLSLIQAWMDGY